MMICAPILLALTSLGNQFYVSVDERLLRSRVECGVERFCDYIKNAPYDKFLANTNFWAKDIDFSCVSPWNSGSRNLRAGTLVSKRHVVCSKHFQLWRGVRILFVGMDGGVCPCYIEKTTFIPDTDIMLCLLNVEVTPNIHPAKILPEDAELYLGTGEGLPIVTFDQNEKLYVNELTGLRANQTSFKTMRGRPPGTTNRKMFGGKLVRGDSGNPTFAISGNTPILLYCVLGPNSGSGFALHLYQRELQGAMDALCPGYFLDIFKFKK